MPTTNIRLSSPPRHPSQDKAIVLLAQEVKHRSDPLAALRKACAVALASPSPPRPGAQGLSQGLSPWLPSHGRYSATIRDQC